MKRALGPWQLSWFAIQNFNCVSTDISSKLPERYLNTGNSMNQNSGGTTSLHELYAKLANSVDAVIAGQMDVQKANAVVALCSTAVRVASVLLKYQELQDIGALKKPITALEGVPATQIVPRIENHSNNSGDGRNRHVLDDGRLPKDMGLKDFGIR